jgi:16S rRNA (adenine(1408)-N(1))-methyltransferase
MIVITGDKKQEIDKQSFENLCKKFEKAILDIGTGDGRFVLKNALKDKKNLYVGMDPAEKQLKISSKKVNRKRLSNSLFILGSIENTPPELFSLIDKIFINLPWGTLLEKIVKSENSSVKNLYDLLKDEGEIEVIFGYLPELEPSETKRLDLPKISSEVDVQQIFSSFKKHFTIVEMLRINKKDLGKLETTWAKKLKFGNDRDIYRIILKKIS